MSTTITLELPAESAARLADPAVQERLRAALAAEGIGLRDVVPVQIVEPCPTCGSREIKFTNCGYSSFDMASAECQCGHRIVVTGSDARDDWNMFARDPQSRQFSHWLMRHDRQTTSSHDMVRKAAEIYRGVK